VKPRLASAKALRWAAEQKTAYPADKVVLFGLAYCANDTTLLAFPSVAALVEFASLERKRVMSSLARLAGGGWIEDTGERIGATKQVKVWRLVLDRKESGSGTVCRD
jgi:pyocin large subunit-like protein